MNNNDIHQNAKLPLLTQLISGWHYERNLIEGSSAKAQTIKLLEEFTELVAAINPNTSSDFIYDELISMINSLHEAGRIKPVSLKEAPAAYLDSLGDMYVVQVNLAEQAKTSMSTCVNSAWGDIKDRKGILWDGIFVKSTDKQYAECITKFKEQQHGEDD